LKRTCAGSTSSELALANCWAQSAPLCLALGEAAWEGAGLAATGIKRYQWRQIQTQL